MTKAENLKSMQGRRFLLEALPVRLGPPGVPSPKERPSVDTVLIMLSDDRELSESVEH